MIQSFRCNETRKIFHHLRSAKFPAEMQRRALRKLEMLAAANRLDTLKVPPANRLEKLSGDRHQQWSIRVNNQWRICFEWRNGHAYDVEIVDYH